MPLCRPAATFAIEPHGATWLARARQLLHEHLGLKPNVNELRGALDAALASRAELVEKKRRQLEEFFALSPHERRV